MKTESRDPKSLRRHPLHKAHVPEPQRKTKDREESPEWAAFAETVEAEGRIQVPIIITHDGFVMDGWWRREAACAYQFATVPCVIESGDQAPLYLVESLTARKQMTRGAAVYLALGLLPEYANAANSRASRNGAAGRTTNEERIDPRPKVGSTSHPSSRYLAKRWGCSYKTVLQAQLIRSVFHNRPAFESWCKAENGLHLPASHAARRDPETAQARLREQMEPLLFNGEKSLWSILQAAAGRLTTEEGKPAGPEQLDLFTDGLQKFVSRALRLTDLKAGKEAIREIVGAVEQGSDLHRLAQFAAALEEAAKARTRELAAAE